MIVSVSKIILLKIGKKGSVLFNAAFNTFNLLVCGVGHIVNGLCYTSHGALAGTRNSSMGPP